MYIDRIRKIRFTIFAFFQVWVGGFFFAVAFGGTISMLGNFEEVKSVWGMFPFLAVISGIILLFGIRNLVTVKSCNVFNEAFVKIGGRVIESEKLSLRTGIDEGVVLRRVQLLIKRKCLIDVYVDFAGTKPVIILGDNGVAGMKRNNSLAEYLVVRCPNCGSSCSVKKGAMTKCQFCGGYIEGN